MKGPPVEIQRSLPILNRYGLHARPAMKFVERASRFASEIYVTKDGQEVNGKSILGLMTLAAECGSTLHLRIVGEDAEAAAEALGELLESRFGEDGPAEEEVSA